ncbi:MAG: hypothetical protein KF749_06795 [Bacteroidetes bacterium]|nr:hypothetical protein [Bacteroidota bacterium]MCW5896941.1 hypothetical protein [Bacteroidota bacterium]
MTHIEQRKVINELRDFERKMNRNEQEDFRMFVKRDKDDEDLDDLSKKKLLAMHEKYVLNKPKRTIKSPFGDYYEQ